MSTEPTPLPGLEVAPGRKPTALLAGVRRTIAAHAQVLTEKDAGKLAIAVELAEVATSKRAAGRMSTVSNDLRLLMEVLDSLDPASGEAGADQQLRDAMDEWSREVGSGAVDATPEVRDEA